MSNSAGTPVARSRPPAGPTDRLGDRRGIAVGLGLWAAAVGLALGAQYLLTPLGRVADGALLYALAAALALAGWSLIDRTVPPDVPTEVGGDSGDSPALDSRQHLLTGHPAAD